MVKIGIIKETKTPVDNRVALTPKEILGIQEKYPQSQFYVQKSDIRAYADEARRLGCNTDFIEDLEGNVLPDFKAFQAEEPEKVKLPD